MFRQALLLCVFLALSAGKTFAQAATYSYDALGRLVGVVDQNGNAAKYTYDAAGNVLSITRYTNAQVTVLSFTPASGPVGTTVTISGSNFSATATQNAVLFNGKSATVSSATTTSLKVTVPAGATTGTIKVTSPVGNATSAQSFTVTSSSGTPTITGYTPNIVSAGSPVTINGLNFNPSPANDRLALNGFLFSTPSSATATTLAATVPLSVGSGHVSIQTPAGFSTSAVDLFIPPAPYTPAQVGFTGRTTSGVVSLVSLPNAGTIGMTLFDAAPGQKISMESLNSGIPSCTLQLYDSTNAVFGPGVNCANNSFIDAQPVARAGTYTALVVPSSSYGNVQLRLHLFTDAVASTTVGGGSVTISTKIPGQNGVVSFSATAGQRVVVNIPSATYSSCSLYVLRPDGTQSSSASCAYSQPTSLDLGVLTQTGQYSLIVDPQGTDTGSVTFNLLNATAVNGGTVTFGSPVTQTTTIPDQTASLTFTGTVGQRISILGTGTFQNGNGAYVYLSQPNGSTLSTFYVPDNSTGFLDATTLPVAGTYTIITVPQSGATGKITLTPYNLPADAAATGTIGGAAVTVATTVPGQNGALTFPANTGQRVLLYASSSTYSSCNLRIYDTANNYIAGLTCSSASKVGVDLGVFSQTGTYTVVVDPQGASIGQVSLQLVDASTLSDGTETLGQPVTVATTASDQSGTFTFSGTAGEKISAIAVGQYYNGAYARVVYTNPDGSQLTYFNVSNGSQTFLDVTTLPATGTYTVTVSPQYGSLGKTTITTYQVPANATATLTIGGAAATLTTTVAGQNAVATFTGTAGQHVLLSSLLSSFATCNMQVLAPNSSVLASPSCAYAITNETDLGTLTATGTYTVTIDPQGPLTGSVQLQARLYGGTSGTSIAIGGAPVPVTATTAGQTGTLTFSATSGQRIDLTAYGEYPSGGGATIYLKLPNSSVLTYVNTSNNSTSDLGPITLPVTGTYQLLVEPGSTTTGTTLISLYSVPADVVVAAVSTKLATATTSAPGQRAIFTFSGTAGTSISFLALGYYSQNAYAAANVIAPDGSNIAGINIYSGSNTFLDQVALPLTGTYQIQVQAAQGASGQTRLTYYALPADISVATNLNASDVTVALFTPGQNAEVTFNATAGQRIIWYADVATFSNCNMQAFAPDGTYLNSLTCDSAAVASVDLGVLTQSGTYTLFINPQGGDTGRVSTRVANVPLVSGGTLTSGTAASVSTTQPGQQASFTFHGTVGQKISIVGKGAYRNAGYAQAYLNRPFGGQLTYFTIYDQSSSFLDATVLPATGTYTLTIVPSGLTFGTTSITLYTIPTPPITAATVGGGSVTVATTVPGQNGTISLPVTAGQHVVWQASSSTYSNCSMRIYDPAQNYVSGLTCNSLTPTYVDLGTLNTTGTYTAVIDPQGTDTGSVTVSFANATTIDAGALVSGTAVFATNTVQNQQTRYTFSGTAGKTFSMLATGTYINNGTAYIYVYEPDNTLLTYFSVSNGNTSFLQPTALPVSGTYTVLVIPQGTTLGTAKLTFYNIPASATATATVGGAAVHVTTTVPGQNAIISFNGTAGQKISVVATGSYALNGQASGSLLPSGGQSLTNFNIYNQSTSTAGPVALPSSGVYQIVITPYQSTVGTTTVSVIAN